MVDLQFLPSTKRMECERGFIQPDLILLAADFCGRASRWPTNYTPGIWGYQTPCLAIGHAPAFRGTLVYDACRILNGPLMAVLGPSYH